VISTSPSPPKPSPEPSTREHRKLTEIDKFIETFTMGHEDAVYLAKLAEQAERYEGSH
jgi:hypothetical protein